MDLVKMVDLGELVKKSGEDIKHSMLKTIYAV